jgi:hypothetical protein
MWIERGRGGGGIREYAQTLFKSISHFPVNKQQCGNSLGDFKNASAYLSHIRHHSSSIGSSYLTIMRGCRSKKERQNKCKVTRNHGVQF